MAHKCVTMKVSSRRIRKLLQLGSLDGGLLKGAQRPEVTAVQRFLKRYAYLDVGAPVIDGALCTETVEGIRRFRRSNGLERSLKLDGEVLTAMLRQRCGMWDYSIAFAGRTRWKKLDLSYAFGDIDPLSNQTLDARGFRSAVERALKTWQDALPGLDFREVARHQNPHFTLGWADPQTHDELDPYRLDGPALAHAEYPPRDGLPPPQPLYVHFDRSEHQWADGLREGAYDMETVALHEIGHILGLFHSEVPGTVMHNVTISGTIRRTLHELDIAALYSLYTPRPGRRVAIRAVNGRYVTARKGGGVPNDPGNRGELIANAEAVGDEQKFDQIDVGSIRAPGGLRFALAASNGKYVCAEGGGGGEVVSNRLWIHEWETFWAIPLGDSRYAFQSYNDQFLRIDAGGRVLAKGDWLEPAAVFMVIPI